MKVTADCDAYVPALAELGLSDGYALKGDEFDVPDLVGASLVAQGWKQSGASKSKPRVAKGEPSKP